MLSPEARIVPIEVGRKWTPCSEQTSAREVETVSVDGWSVANLLKPVQVLLIRELQQEQRCEVDKSLTRKETIW